MKKTAELNAETTKNKVLNLIKEYAEIDKRLNLLNQELQDDFDLISTISNGITILEEKKEIISIQIFEAFGLIYNDCWLYHGRTKLFAIIEAYFKEPTELYNTISIIADKFHASPVIPDSILLRRAKLKRIPLAKLDLAIHRSHSHYDEFLFKLYTYHILKVEQLIAAFREGYKNKSEILAFENHGELLSDDSKTQLIQWKNYLDFRESKKYIELLTEIILLERKEKELK